MRFRTRRVLATGVIALALLLAAIWVLSRAYPSLWCSIVGACNA